MIFFKTDRELEEQGQLILKNLYRKRLHKFLLLPRWLANGQLAWLQYVYKDYGICKGQWGEYSLGEISYHLEE